MNGFFENELEEIELEVISLDHERVPVVEDEE
jgi:hypothetical protein